MAALRNFLSRPGVSKKIIPFAVGGVLMIAMFAFVILVGDKNPAKIAKERQRAEEIEKVKAGKESTQEDAKAKLAQIESELVLARARERDAIDQRMSDAQKPANQEDEAKRVAEALKIDLPRSPSSGQVAGIDKEGKPMMPDPTDTRAAALVDAHASTDPNKGALAIAEFYTTDKVRGISQDANPQPSTQPQPQKAAGQQSYGMDNDSGFGTSKRTDRVENGPAIKPTMPNKAITKNYMLSQGSVIRTVFITGVNTQHPGEVIVRTTEDVYDSILGNNLLIPKGTRMVGKSEEVKVFNQQRHPITFDRLIFPDGRSMKLPKMPAVSRTGETGAAGEYHSNLLPAIMPSLIAGVFGIALDYMVTKDTNENTSTTNTVGTGMPNGATQPGQTVARQVFPDLQKRLSERYSGVKPYFTIDPGTPFTVQVNADFAIPPDDEPVLVKKRGSN